MQERTYPFNAFVLTPAMLVKEITLVEPYGLIGAYAKYSRSESGKVYHENDLHPTIAKAIEAGLAQLAAQQEKLIKQQWNINKKAANLRKMAEQHASN